MAGHLLDGGHTIIAVAHRNPAPIEPVATKGATEA